MTLTRALTGLVMLSTAIMLVVAIAHTAGPPQGEERIFYNLQVLKLGSDDFHYQFRDTEGVIFWGRFCNDYEPQFDAGETLTILKVRDFGACWSVRDTHPAYLIKRDERGTIIREDFHVEGATVPETN